MTSKVPKPGEPVRGSKSGKPIMALFDLLGRSWALGVIWQLSRDAMTFRQLQDKAARWSPRPCLNRRLKELTSSDLIQRGDKGYQLTAAGLELFEMLKPFGTWSEKWADRLTRD